NTFNHNDRVDISAPGCGINVLEFDNTRPHVKNLYNVGSGTSLSSPIVAGALGLINSVNPCLTPYQREFLLKYNSNRLIYNIPENQKYSPKKELGVGRLDAFESVSAADSFDCNNPNFKTMYIE